MQFYIQSFPAGSYQLVDILDPMSGVSQLNFGFIPLPNPWRNSDNALDVNGDGQVTAIDALLGINYINTHDTTQPLPPVRQAGEKCFDVNNDGYISAVDILMVINQLNKPQIPPPSGEATYGSSSLGGGGIGGSAGGEADTISQPLVPGMDLAAQYYRQNPLQVLEVAGSAGCTCTQCTAITDVASGRVSASTAIVNTAASPAANTLELQSFALMKKEAALLARSDAGIPHIDGSLLDTIASATQAISSQSDRRSRK
jgi:hypothetical protein